LDHFTYNQKGELYVESLPVQQLAKEYGTPLYIYSRATLERHWNAFNDGVKAHPHLICYAVKANSNIAVLNLFARLGSGFDIVSQGELERVLMAGGKPENIMYSGVGKKTSEIVRALDVGIRCFNVESEPELERINDIAQRMGKIASISLRINPDVDAKTHPYISTGLKENKFGISVDRAICAYQRAAQLKNLKIMGMDCHIGSQLTTTKPFIDAVDRLLMLIDKLATMDIHIKHLDVGGGLGVTYTDEKPPLPFDYAKVLLEKIHDRPDLELIFEPGRAIAANAGILVAQVEYLKETEDKNFMVVDAAMNDLIRPVLYQAYQQIIPVIKRDVPTKNYDVVGPICETGDFLGKDRSLACQPDDFIAVRSAGAYGFTMSSNYNSRTRAAEIMVDGDRAYVIRQREKLEHLWELEQVLPE